MNTRKNAMYNVAYRVFSILLPLVTAPYIARVAGQAGKGLYDYAWSISEIFVIIATLGLADYGVRAIARVRDDRKALDRAFSEVYLMQLVVSSAVLVIWLGYTAFVANAEKTIALHLTMMSVSCLVNVDWCLMGLGEFRPIALRNTCVKLLAALGVFLFVRSGDDLWIYALIWSGATLAGCLLCWPNLRGKVSLRRVTLRSAMRHFPPCALLLVSVLAVRVYRTMDKVMVGAIAGMAQNGLYSSAEQIVYCLSGFISAIGTVLMPRAANLPRQRIERCAEGTHEQCRVGTRTQHDGGGSAGQNKLPAEERRHPVFPRKFGHAVGAVRRDGLHALRGDFRHFPVHVAAFVRAHTRVAQGFVKVRGDGRSVHTSPRQNKDTNAFQALMRFSV